MGELTEVRFGIKTGANAFFYLDALQIDRWGIEEEFLKPVIKSPRECKQISIDVKHLKYRLFMCHKDKAELRGTAALEYIKSGEAQGVHRVPSVASRARWWDLGIRRIPSVIAPSSVSELARTFKNNGVYADKRLYEIHTARDIDTILVASNATTSTLFLELGSRTGLGEGLLDLTVYELADCLIVAPDQLRGVGKVLADMSKRRLLSLHDELAHPTRQAFDAIVFESLSLTSGERAAVYEAVIDLVEARLKKATSLDPKQRKRRSEAVRKTVGIWADGPEDEEEEDSNSDED